MLSIRGFPSRDQRGSVIHILDPMCHASSYNNGDARGLASRYRLCPLSVKSGHSLLYRAVRAYRPQHQDGGTTEKMTFVAGGHKGPLTSTFPDGRLRLHINYERNSGKEMPIPADPTQVGSLSTKLWPNLRCLLRSFFLRRVLPTIFPEPA